MTAIRCQHCGRTITRKSAIETKAGLRCKRCADRLPPYGRRPPKPQPKEKAS
jgi:hypothetical protein